MWHNLAQLPRYRGLIQSLVARELKARYRGSVLGFFWSFVNPLLLLTIYTFVFTKILPGANKDLEPYAVFMFCGPAAVDVVSSSLLEGAGSLISGGNLIKKVLFPAEVLPIVSVLSNMVHFFLGLLILAGFMIYNQHYPDWGDLIWFPVVVLVQLVFTIGLALLLVGADRALPRHPRPAGQSAHALVLRDADHLLLQDGERAELRVVLQFQSVLPSRRCRIRRSCSFPARSAI